MEVCKLGFALRLVSLAAAVVLAGGAAAGDAVGWMRVSVPSNSIGVVSHLYDVSTGWLDASRGADGTWVEYARSDGGAVTSIASVAGTTAYSLDAAGRRTSLATPSAEFGFGYCGWNGRLAALTMPADLWYNTHMTPWTA